MKQFLGVNDIGNLQEAVREALEVKHNRYNYQHLGKNKTLLMITMFYQGNKKLLF